MGHGASVKFRRLIFFSRLFFWLMISFIGLSLILVIPFAWLTPPGSSFMLQNEIITDLDADHEWIPREQMSPYLAIAAIAAEDQRFPQHGGFDFEELKKVLAKRKNGKPLRGASTISQQTAKNLYLWPKRSLLRKGLEAWLTMLMEIFWSKQRILEIYLNIVQFADHTYGVEAASQRFFNKPAKNITREEAALLVAVLPGPSIYHIDEPSDYVLNRQRWILKQIRQLGGLSYLGSIDWPYR